MILQKDQADPVCVDPLGDAVPDRLGFGRADDVGDYRAIDPPGGGSLVLAEAPQIMDRDRIALKFKVIPETISISYRKSWYMWRVSSSTSSVGAERTALSGMPSQWISSSPK